MLLLISMYLLVHYVPHLTTDSTALSISVIATIVLVWRIVKLSFIICRFKDNTITRVKKMSYAYYGIILAIFLLGAAPQYIFKEPIVLNPQLEIIVEEAGVDIDSWKVKYEPLVPKCIGELIEGGETSIKSVLSMIENRGEEEIEESVNTLQVVSAIKHFRTMISLVTSSYTLWLTYMSLKLILILAKKDKVI